MDDDRTKLNSELANSEKWYLIKYAANVGDKFEGFNVASQTDLDRWMLELDHIFQSGPFGFSVGSNLDMEYTSKEELLSHLSTQEITVDAAKMLFKFFGKYGFCSFGFTPYF